MANEPMTALASWLLTYAAHSTLLVGGAYGLQRAVLRTAAARDLLWKLASFAALGTATIHTLVLSNSQRLEPLAGRWEVMVVVPATPVSVAAPPRQMVVPPALQSELPNTAASTPMTLDEPTRTLLSPRPRPRPRPLPSWPVALVAVWLVGASCALWLLRRRYRRAQRRFAARTAVTDGALRSLLDQLAQRTGVTRPVMLTVCDGILSPVALSRAEMCLPSGLLPVLTPSQQESMLAHELAHLERRDPQWLLAFAWLEACFFFQPLHRLARKQFQSCAEQLCDGWALAHTSQPLALAQCLAEVARWLRGERDPLPYPGMAESAAPLLARVQRVLSGAREPLVVRPQVRWSLSIALAGFACIAPGITGVTRAASLDEASTDAQALDLAAAVQRAGSGVLRFRFETRDGVCGTGEEKDGTRMFALQPTREWRPAGNADRLALYVWDDGVLIRNDVGTDGRWTTPCKPGDARVDLSVRAGKAYALDLSVGDPAPRAAVQDLGRADPKLASRFLLELTRNEDQELARRALLAAMIARAGVSRGDLQTLESDQRAPAAVRNAAVSWSAALQLDTQQPTRGELSRIADLRLPFADRLAALAQATRAGLQPAELMAFYPRVPDRAMRVELIDWLAQRENEQVRAHLKQIVRDAVVWEEQQATLRALAASRAAGARAFAESYLEKQPPIQDEVVNARVNNDTYSGAPQSALARRIAAARDGVVRVRYDARAEACGSGMDRDGAGMFALLPTDRWRPAGSAGVAAFYSFDHDDFTRLALTPNSSWVSNCQNGPAQLLIDVRDGRVVNLRIVVGDPVEGTTIDTDLGRVPGPEAAAYLIELAKRAGQTIASNAILAAVIAAGEPLLYPTLLRIAADLSRPERVRQTALYWVALDPTPGAAEALERNRASLPSQGDDDRPHADFGNERSTMGEQSARFADVNDLPTEVVLRVALDPRQTLETRKKAIEWAEDRNVSPSVLTSLYDRIAERDLKLFLLDFLGGCDNEATSRKLIEIAAQDADPEMRAAARRSLRKHQNPVARANRTD